MYYCISKKLNFAVLLWEHGGKIILPENTFLCPRFKPIRARARDLRSIQIHRDMIKVERQNQSFARTHTLYNVSTNPSNSPSPSQPLDSVICQYSVSYSLSVGTVGYNLCRHQEQIISAKPAPYFGVFNFQIVLPDVSSVGQAPPPLQSMVAKIVVCSCDILSCVGCPSSSSSS